MASEPKDPIEAAIKATDQPAETRAQLNVTISSTGRQVGLNFPIDLTDPELIEFIGWVATGLRNGLVAERQKRGGGRIIIPHGVLPS